MKKIFLSILIFVILVLNLTGCGKEISIDKLNGINNRIINYFEKNDIQDYKNYSYNYVDEERKSVVVGLIDNSKQQQEWFRKNVVDSKYIIFEVGGKTDIKTEELINIQNKIIDIVSKSEKDYSNFFSCFVDEKNKAVIIGLANNNIELQKWFKENTINYKNMQFKKESYAWNYESGIYIFIENVIKPDIKDVITFKNYFKLDDRIIYISNDIDEFYIISSDRRKETLKQYVLRKNFDEQLKTIKDKLNMADVIYDGGTTLYQDNSKNVAMLICKTLEGNKDIYIGNSSTKYEQDMCK